MASYLFHVKIVERSDVDVTFELRIISGDQPDFYSGRGFALMLLYDPIKKGLTPDAPLGRQVSKAELADVDWMHEHVEDYVDDAIITDTTNYPITANTNNMSPDEIESFFRSDRAPTAVFDVSVTKPEFSAHMTPGMEWDSAAYDPFIM